MTPILQRQRGAVTIMVAVALLVLLAVAGLVVDSGLAYMVKARLNAAVDSAALAAARAVTDGNTQEAQRASAQTAADQFFAANIPQGYLSSKPTITEKTVTFSAGTVTIDIAAKAPMPVSLMQLLGFTSMNPVATAQTIRRDLDMALVVDRSGSLAVDGSAPTVQKSAISFLNKFNVTQDRVGLISFAAGASIDRAISTDTRGFNRAAMVSAIGSYDFEGGTSSVEGLWNAREQLNLIPLAKRSAMRVIVFFSDGQPTGLGTYQAHANPGLCTKAGSIQSTGSGLWSLTETNSEISDYYCKLRNNPAKTLSAWYNAHNPGNELAKREFRLAGGGPRTVTDDIGSTDMLKKNINAAAYNLAEAVAAKAREEKIFVFTLGLGASLKDSSGYNGENNEAFLKCMANVPEGPSRCYKPAQPVGMYCYAATDADLTPCFSKLASAILRISK
ncbi:VWA domain-containing protein [Massilia dura]|uniref:VWA domain-containing protein n=1 Tax=Pseudoduganella dura TaxID=321982 RepID=A0A6I3XA22_9BURK|nr:vWA domain-containing protein [Pseudoduganella dura]MUI11450.1 VWA domain-containing protein [Pseudoduganella dura]GGX97644.1 hypothetical protein GCM10007386_30800 [Pseudoduganella dura]